MQPALSHRVGHSVLCSFALREAHPVDEAGLDGAVLEGDALCWCGEGEDVCAFRGMEADFDEARGGGGEIVLRVGLRTLPLQAGDDAQQALAAVDWSAEGRASERA